MTAAENGNWYMVTHDGTATLCIDQEDAQAEAVKADRNWPHMGPHRAVRLVEGRTMGSLSGHQSAAMKHDEWLTPPAILRPLGLFDLDPCAPIMRPWDMALKHYNVNDDGLAQPWSGRVWCNPPFGREAAKWLARLAVHGNGIALIPARTETAMFYASVWGVADAICFVRGRPHFHLPSGERAPFNSGAPICLIAYGNNNAASLRASGLGYVAPAKDTPT